MTKAINRKKLVALFHKKDTTALASISSANLDNWGRCLYNNVVESLSTQKLNIEMFKHILWESVYPTRYRHIGSAELLHHAIGSVGRSCTKQNPTLISRSDYIEHHFEARAMLPPIFDVLCNRLFLFCHFSQTPFSSESTNLKNRRIRKGWVAQSKILPWVQISPIA